MPSLLKNLLKNSFKNFELIGSAHNFKEIKIKENQKINIYFITNF